VMQSAKVAKRWPTAAAQTASVSGFHCQVTSSLAPANIVATSITFFPSF